LLIALASLASVVHSQKTFIRIESPANICVIIDSIDHGRIKPGEGAKVIKHLSPGVYHAIFRYEGKELRDTIVIRDKNERILYVDIENDLIDDRSQVDRPSKQAILHYVHPVVCYDTVLDIRDKQSYRTIKIGDQVWMAENLNFKTKSGSTVYPLDPIHETVYGRLYAWDAAVGACPERWHLPEDEEWKELEEYLGMDNLLQNGRGWRELTVEHSLKSTVGWISGERSVDRTGFSALPGGYCDGDMFFYNEGYFSYFWTATETDTSDAWYRVLTYDIDAIGKFSFSKKYRFSVRCIKDNPDIQVEAVNKE